MSNVAHWKQRIAPVEKDKSKTAAAYDRMSAAYDTFVGRLEGRYRDVGLAALAPIAGERILELGCGTGHALLALARAVGATGRVTGVDLSSRMCALARTRIATSNVTCAVDVQHGDVTKLSASDHSVDAAFASFTLELLSADDISLALSELTRVLAPGGRLGVVSLALPESPTLGTKLYLLSHAWFPRFVDCRPIPGREILVEAGYDIERADTHSMWGLPVDCIVARRA